MKLDHMELDELRIRPSGNRPTDNSPSQGPRYNKVPLYPKLLKVEFKLVFCYLQEHKKMAEDWAAEVAAATPTAAAVAEMPEIMLFDRWSCDEVQVSDISLTVSLRNLSKTAAQFDNLQVYWIPV